MTLGCKIRILRENRGWTQATLAAKLIVSPDTVQKWEVEKNTPPLAALKDIAQVLDTPINLLSDGDIEIIEYYHVNQNDVYPEKDKQSDSPHLRYDANLRNGALLHRFDNPRGVPYSSICIGSKEIWSCERDHEKRMVDAWNEDDRL